MQQLDSKKLDELVKAKKWDEAKILIEDCLKSPLTDEEKGEVYAQFASLYMQIKTEMMKDYEKQLSYTIDVLKKIREKEKMALKVIV